MMIEKHGTGPDGQMGTKEGYLVYSHRKVLFILGCAVALFILSLITLNQGDTDLSFGEIIYYVFHPDDSWNATVVWGLRIRLIIAAILAGAALGVAGSVMQSILRNPLASPFTLGLSNAAAFGASVAIIAGTGSISVLSNLSSSPFFVTLFAFTFAMLATGVMLVLVKLTECTPETIVLSGTALSAIFSAMLAFLQYIADDTQLASIVYWQFGSLGKVDWDELLLIAVVLIVATAYFFYKRWDYNAMEAGEDVARGLGVNVRRTRIVGLIMSAILTAVVVSFMGVIGFIGLIGPHMVKRVIGNDNRFVLPASMLVGALILMVAYIVGSFAFYTVIPVGIITSAIGGPAFIYILVRGRRKR